MPNRTAENNRTETRTNAGARRRHRRRPSRFAYALMLAAAACCLITVLILVAFKVREVKVDGGGVYTAAQVRQASGIGPGDNLLGINKGQAAARITKELPYIRSVKILLRPPATVIVQVTPGKAVSAVAVSGGYALLDGETKVLEIRGDLKGLSLPLVKGLKVSSALPGKRLVTSDAEQVKLLALLEQELKANKLEQITQIDLSNQLELSAVYQGRVTIVLGTSSDLARKVRFAAYLLAGKITAQEKGSLDVSKVGKAYFDPA
jgi:cell division protein FtsQ